MKCFWLLALAIFCMNCMAQTSRKDESMLVYGTGQLSCGKWTAAREEKNETQTNLFLQWIAGWLVSYNYYASESKQKRVEVPDFESITAFTDQFCRANPLKPVFVGVAELVEAAGGAKALHNRVRKQ